MGVQSKQIFEFDSYELDKTFADFDNFVLIKSKKHPFWITSVRMLIRENN